MNRVWVTSLFALPDGRVLAQDVFGNNLWRFNSDGTPDVAFGAGGGAALFGPTCPRFSCYSQGIARDADGRIVVGAGSGAIRLLPDGSVDASFGRAGVAWVHVPDGSFSVTAVVVQADGTIVIAGSLQHSTPGPAFPPPPTSAALIRLLPTGAPDSATIRLVL